MDWPEVVIEKWKVRVGGDHWREWRKRKIWKKKLGRDPQLDRQDPSTPFTYANDLSARRRIAGVAFVGIMIYVLTSPKSNV